MYRWVDRPFGSLEVRARFLVWSMRHWWRDNTASGRGCLHVGPAFHSYGLVAALPDFQIVMLSLRDTMIEPLQLGCDEVSEHEAIMLALLEGCANGKGERDGLEQVLGRLVRSEGLERMVHAMIGLSTRLAPANYSGWQPDEESRTL